MSRASWGDRLMFGMAVFGSTSRDLLIQRIIASEEVRPPRPPM
jgi:hypothetical protein